MTEINLNKLGIMASTNLEAYDLASFEERQRNTRATSAHITSIANTRRRSEKIKSMVQVILICSFLIAILSGIVLSATQLNELTSKAAKLKKENALILSENKRLHAEFDMLIDLSEVESRALNNLYMQKVDPSQVTFISLSKEDIGKTTERTENFLLKSIKSVKNSVLNLLEFVY